VALGSRKTLHSEILAFASVGGLLLLVVLSWMAAANKEQGGCHFVRIAVDEFTADMKKSPRSVEELIRSGYLRRSASNVPALEDCVSSR
jgi:hypothetical protein